MDIYVVGIALVAIIIMLSMMTHGFHTGFAHELTSLISLVAAIFVILLISGIIEGWRSGSASNLAVGLILLVIFGVVYRIVKVCMVSINFIANLPVIHWLDSALGLVCGFVEGFAILYVIEYFLRNYLLA